MTARPKVQARPRASRARRKSVSADESARRALENDWTKRLNAFEKLAKQDADALSQDDVHHMRVTTRRLRASLWVVRHCMESKRAEQLHRDLRGIGQALGERRMWDIALDDAEHYRGETREIKKRRERAHARMRRALRNGRVRAAAKDLKRLERAISGMMLERLAPWLQGYEWELAYGLMRRPETPKKRHELRIQAKKVRYVLECLGRRVPSLEKLQDHLGREHDLIVVREIIGAKRGLARDQRIARTSANRVMPRALRSAMRQLHALQKEIRR
jgi:CHAD domain-containing protein